MLKYDLAPGSALAVAALAGLLGVAACSDDKSEAPAKPPDGTKAEIVSSIVDETMTLEKFTEKCDEFGGAVETHAVCGGANTCKGLSYDDATHVLTSHTCKGLNTCSGYSCVIPDFEG